MNRIRMLREQMGMTQGDLAALISCRDATISRYEKERLGIDVATIGKLCDIFGVTADYLLCRSDQPTPEISAEDWALLSAYHRASLRDRDLVDRILSAWAEPAQEKGTAG